MIIYEVIQFGYVVLSLGKIDAIMALTMVPDKYSQIDLTQLHIFQMCCVGTTFMNRTYTIFIIQS
jgi:hypothetical protein